MNDGAADELFAALASAMVPVAQSADRVESTAATHEQVDLVYELERVSRAVAEHCREVMITGRSSRWAELADMFGAASDACRRQTMLGTPHLASPPPP